MNERLTSRLARRTTGGRWIPEIDGLRCVAIMLVLVSHVVTSMALAAHQIVVVEPPFGDTFVPPRGDLLAQLARQGRVGVHVFFMISGFVLALPFISHRQENGERVDLRRYFRRRITRIEPPYLIVMASLFIGSWLVGTHVALKHLAASAGYVHGLVFGMLSPLNGVAWTLEVEVQFYILVPALAVLLCTGPRRARREMILLLAITMIVLQTLGFVTTRHASSFLGSFLQFFLVGWLLADIYVVDWHREPETRRVWDFVALPLIPLLLLGLARVGMFEQVIAPWVVLGIGVCAFRGPVTRRLLSNTWVAIVGGMCYSIYLVHYPLFILLQHAVSPITGLPSPFALFGAIVVLVPLALVAGGLFFVTVERPFMDPEWWDRLIARFRTRRPSVDVSTTPAVELVEIGSDRRA